MLIFGILIALIPPDLGARLAPFAHGERARALVDRIARIPATVGEGFRFAVGLFAHPSRGGLAVLGAAGFWATSIGVLWASFHAFGVHVPLAVVVQGFFLGMVANLFPLAPAGVGAVDAGLIGCLRPLWATGPHGLPGDPDLSPDRVLDADPTRDHRLLPASQTVQRWELEGRPIRPRRWSGRVDRPGTIKSKVLDFRRRDMAEKKVENVIIVGGGPAGYTAALYTARANLEPLVFEGFHWGGQLQNTTDVENYPGYPEGIMGPEMMNQFRAQAERFGTRFVSDDVDRVELSRRRRSARLSRR